MANSADDQDFESQWRAAQIDDEQHLRLAAFALDSLRVNPYLPEAKNSQPGEGHKIYPYLLKDVEVTRVNQGMCFLLLQ